MTIKVLVVDDSALVRRVVSRLLEREPDIQIVGVAADAYVARDLIVERHPDVVTLDVEMPRMNGLAFLERLMRYQPTPVVLLSSLAQEGSDTALEALRLGAVRVLDKRSEISARAESAPGLVAAVREAAQARVAASAPPRPAQTVPPLLGFRSRTTVLIGASTGGTVAVEELLRCIPADAPPVLVTQHLPAGFDTRFAQRLNAQVPMRVKVAEDGEALRHGQVLVAPGDRHLAVAADGARLVARLLDAPPVNYHRPAVDVLFQSGARQLGRRAVGVLLTGMGVDGARGLAALRQAGATTLAQDQSTSVIYGMPRAAAELNAAQRILPLPDMAGAIIESLQRV